MRSQQEIQEQAAENRSKLLTAEAGLLALLLRRNRSALRLSTAAAAMQMQRGLADAVYQGRLAARNVGLLRLQTELASLGEHIDLPLITAAERVYDAQRSGLFAQRFAADWYNRTDVLSKRAANEAMAWRLRTAAATEASEAFNSARTAVLRRVQPTVQILKVWDSQLDQRRCRVCASNEGLIVAYNEPFPNGEPGAVHPRCRCNYTLLTQDEAGLIEPQFIGAPTAND